MLEDGEFGDPPKDGEILSFLAKAGLDKARPNAFLHEGLADECVKRPVLLTKYGYQFVVCKFVQFLEFLCYLKKAGTLEWRIDWRIKLPTL